MKRILMSAFIVGFLLINAVGVSYSGTMMGHGEIGMADCPLMGYSAAVCNMNPLEHVSMWQTMFAAIPVQSAVFALLLLLAFFFFTRFRELLWLFHSSPQPIRIFYDPEIGTHDPLRLFMARGLMHPKIF